MQIVAKLYVAGVFPSLSLSLLACVLNSQCTIIPPIKSIRMVQQKYNVLAINFFHRFKLQLNNKDALFLYILPYENSKSKNVISIFFNRSMLVKFSLCPNDSYIAQDLILYQMTFLLCPTEIFFVQGLDLIKIDKIPLARF